ncbi:guanylate kinase domain protein, partial [Bacteroides fragilis str. Korea 419]
MNPTERITTPHKTGEAKVIIFSAPSGSGKSTIINYLLAQKLNLAFSIS